MSSSSIPQSLAGGEVQSLRDGSPGVACGGGEHQADAPQGRNTGVSADGAVPLGSGLFTTPATRKSRGPGHPRFG